jgi:integrase
MEWAHVQLHGVLPEWRVPWRRMKMREPHIGPLSRQAAEILREARLLSGHGRWIFPQLRNPDRPMSECCITAALRAMGYAGTEMSWHGFRSLASTPSPWTPFSTSSLNQRCRFKPRPWRRCGRIIALSPKC